MLQAGQGVQLYRYQQNTAGGSWDPLSANADVTFYDVNRNTSEKEAQWHVEIGTDVDVLVTDQFSIDLDGMRVTVAAESGDVYALKFPTPATLEQFEQEYNSKRSENTHQLAYDKKTKDTVSCCCALVMLQPYYAALYSKLGQKPSPGNLLTWRMDSVHRFNSISTCRQSTLAPS